MNGLVASVFFWQNIIKASPAKIPSKVPYSVSAQAQNRNEIFFSPSSHDDVRARRFLPDKISFQSTVPEKVVVVFAPHPDDEILCCSRTIEAKKKEGFEVKVVYFTDGDAHDKLNALVSKNYGKRRKRESRAATSQLGLEASDLFFLGFPDGQLQDLKSEEIVQSDYTKKRKSDGFSSFPFTPYSQKNLVQNLEKILNRYQIEEVYIPSILDEHPDHKFVGEMVSSLLRENNLFPRVYEYVVHGESFSEEDFEPADTKKLSSIRLFKSQFHTDLHRDFMEQWARVPERFQQIRERFVRQDNLTDS